MPTITDTTHSFRISTERAAPRVRFRVTALQVVAKPAAGLALLGLVLWLMAGTDASTGSILALGRFWIFGITLPGLLVWRLATPFRHNLVEDLAAGALVGASLLLLVYLGCAMVGLQQWAWLWAAPVLVLAATVPTWRERCLRRVERPLTPLAAWLLTLACGLPIYAVGRYRTQGAAPYTDIGSNSPDMAFHQALSASAKYDFPLQAPYVDGDVMNYHYFFHQLTAAIAWGSGVDLTDLIYTLGWFPLLLATAGLIFALTDRLAPASTWTGPVAVTVATLGGTLHAYPGVVLPAEALVNYVWGSPTQNLGGGLMVLLALIGVDVLRGQSGPAGWVLFAVIAAAASGSKATVLPLAVCGLALVVFVQLCYRRLAKGAALALVGFGVVFLLAVLLVFGGHSSGLAVKPWAIFAKLQLYPRLADVTLTPEAFDPRAMWITGVTACLGMLLGTAGLLVLPGTAARWLRDPGMVFLVGISFAGFAGMVLTDQPGASQIYFHRTAVPVIAAVAAAGAWLLVFWFADRKSGLVVLSSLLVGIGATAAARGIVSANPPPGRTFRQPDGTLTGLIAPWVWTVALLLAGAVLVTTVWKLAGRRGRPSRIVMASFVIAGMGAGLYVPLLAFTNTVQTGSPALSDASTLGPSTTQTAGARWLRDNAAPGELIATNAHCVVKNVRGCDNRHFWLAALSERHVLVEGWGYTNTVNDLIAGTGRGANGLPFWDEQKLTDNDRVFTAPTRDNLRVLREQYGVRWLYADPEQTPVSSELDDLATLRFEAPDVRVYELR